jgi:iron(III) transport system ATP-binding protein
VRIRLGERLVLDDFSLDLVPGEIVCLLGESGSGKSTLLRAAAGLQQIEAGAIRINEELVSSPEVNMPPHRRGVGLMFQDFALFSHKTLLQNVLFGLNRLDRSAALLRARTTLTRVGLGDREGDYPHQLSGGQQQRLALARAIAPRPGILMLDEPFSGLDARMRESVRGETLAVLRETRATSLIVTHDPEEAMLLGDRIALLREGRLVQVDAAQKVYAAPADLVAARFLSPLSEISGRVAGERVETPFGPVPAPGLADGTKVTIGLRPVGAVRIATSGAGVPGRILGKRTALGVDICEISVEGLDKPLLLRRASSADLVPGRDVVVSLNVADVLVFALD